MTLPTSATGTDGPPTCGAQLPRRSDGVGDAPRGDGSGPYLRRLTPSATIASGARWGQRAAMPAHFPDAEAAALLVASHGATKAARLASNIATTMAVAGDEAGAGIWRRIAEIAAGTNGSNAAYWGTIGDMDSNAALVMDITD